MASNRVIQIILLHIPTLNTADAGRLVEIIEHYFNENGCEEQKQWEEYRPGSKSLFGKNVVDWIV